MVKSNLCVAPPSAPPEACTRLVLVLVGPPGAAPPFVSPLSIVSHQVVSELKTPNILHL